MNRSQQAATAAAFASVGISIDDEPTVNSQDELAVATSGSHNLRRRSNGRMQSGDVGVGLALRVPHKIFDSNSGPRFLTE